MNPITITYTMLIDMLKKLSKITIKVCKIAKFYVNPKPCNCTRISVVPDKICDKISVKDKIVLIVGGSKGIGLATSKVFKNGGANVISTSRYPNFYDNPLLSKQPLDIRYEDSVTTFFDTVIKPIDKIDIIVICANIAYAGPMYLTNGNNYMDYLNLGLGGCQRIVFNALPYMYHENTKIITLGSFVSEFENTLRSPYTITKYALEAWNDNYNVEMNVMKSLCKLKHTPIFTLLKPTAVNTTFGFYEYYYTSQLNYDDTLISSQRAIMMNDILNGKSPMYVGEAILRIAEMYHPDTQYYLPTPGEQIPYPKKKIDIAKVLKNQNTLPNRDIINIQTTVIVDNTVKSPEYATAILSEI